MLQKPSKRVMLFAVLVTSLITDSLLAQAGVGRDDTLLEEVTVTARKRAESAQDVPVSITAFSGDAMKSLGFESSMDISAQTPNLQTGQNFGEGNNPIISIRGITMLDFTEFNESPSAVYIDDFYKANLAGLDFQLFDLERAEVLRGPQGTLFGRNSTGGLVHYITAKPTQETGGYAELTVGDRGRRKLEAAAGGGLTDTISGRIAAVYDQHDGYVENVGFGDANDRDLYAIRGQLLFEPSDRLSILASAQHGKNSTNGNPYIHHPTTFDPVTGLAVDAPADFFGYAGPALEERKSYLTRALEMEIEVTNALLRVDYEADAFTFVSITGYEQVDKRQKQDPDASPNDIFQTNAWQDGTEWSQELRFLGGQEALRWIGGLYLFSYENNGNQFADVPVFGISPFIDYRVDTDSWALFGQLEYDFSDQWTGSIGVRYTDEDKKFESVNNFHAYPDHEFLFPAQVFTEESVGALTRQSPSNTSFKLTMNYSPADEILLYGTVATGFKGGTYNLGYFPQPSVDVIPVDSEELTSYELGFKSTLSEGRVRLNGAVFYYDYEDYQAFLFDGTTLSNFLFNNDAKVKGAEIELVATPTLNLELIFGASWLDAKLKDVPDQADLVGGVPEIKDRYMPLAPDYSFNSVIRYHLPLFGGDLALQIDGVWVGDAYFDPLNSPALKEKSHYEANLRATWNSGDDRWYVTGYINNVTDETFRLYSFDLTSAIGVTEDIVNKPRWWGVTVGLRW